MFTKQRRNYRVFVYTALVITLCVLVLALMWPKGSEKAGGDMSDIKAGNEVSADNSSDSRGDDKSGSKYYDSNGERTDGNEKSERADKDGYKSNGRNDQYGEDDKTVVSDAKDTYYIVKRKGDRISVFFSGENGEEIELETTDIIYELLTPEDQHTFDEGIKAESQEQLSSILQDFES